MANWSNNFPSWGDTGEQPPSNKNYGDEQVNEKHFDYLWDQLNKMFDEVIAHTIQDDGSVAMDENLDLGSNSIESVSKILGGVAEIHLTSTNDVRLRPGDGAGSPQTALEAQSGGGVSIPEGDLNINSHDVTNISSARFGGGGSRVYVESGHLKLENDTSEAGSIISDGDEVERQIWVIPNGGSDPAGADPNDVILEEEV